MPQWVVRTRPGDLSLVGELWLYVFVSHLPYRIETRGWRDSQDNGPRVLAGGGCRKTIMTWLRQTSADIQVEWNGHILEMGPPTKKSGEQEKSRRLRGFHTPSLYQLASACWALLLDQEYKDNNGHHHGAEAERTFEDSFNWICWVFSTDYIVSVSRARTSDFSSIIFHDALHMARVQ